MHAFQAPVTELVWLTPKAGVSFDRLQKVLRTTVDNMNESAKSDDTLFGAAGGRVVEEEKCAYVAGWSSVEVKAI